MLDSVKTLKEIAHFIEQQDGIIRLLAVVEVLRLPDGWIGAGLIRNAVWDHLYAREPKLITGSDVDVVYFDSREASIDRDMAIESLLRAHLPDVPWSVHNQARMHVRNRDQPYRNTEDALRYWPETATAIAARLSDDRVELIAPYGVRDLIDLTVRPTPRFAKKLDVYRARIAAKRWTERWPALNFVDV